MKKIILIVLTVLIFLIIILNIKVHLQDISSMPGEITMYGCFFQINGVNFEMLDHTSDESIPEEIVEIYVPIKDYFRAKDAIERGHALVGIIGEVLDRRRENFENEPILVK